MGVGLVCASNHCISSGFHSAVATCTNKANSHFLSLLDKQPEIHRKPLKKIKGGCGFALSECGTLSKNHKRGIFPMLFTSE